MRDAGEGAVFGREALGEEVDRAGPHGAKLHFGLPLVDGRVGLGR